MVSPFLTHGVYGESTACLRKKQAKLFLS